LLELLDELDRRRIDLVPLGDDDPAVVAEAQVVENGSVPVQPGVRRAHAKHILQWQDADLIDRLDRSLRRCVVPPHRLNRVADELESDRLRLARRKNVDDAAADGELAMFVRWFLAREAGIDEQLREIGRAISAGFKSSAAPRSAGR
jgi:hypothetical protein